jgi:2-dehydro-3-deoxyphosphogluconate aldolase/(4S)-4-hydroxy-2-oxoglutarate aldolase
LKSADLHVWQSVIDLCAGCGITILEFRDGREARGLKLFPFLVEHAARYPHFQIGVSTIKNIPACESFIREGAAFISSPFLNPLLGQMCRQYNRGWIPGCSTLEDIRKAVSSGAEVVSVLSGPLANGNLREIAMEFGQTGFMPSSGNELDHTHAAEWLAAGALSIRKEQTIFPSSLISIRDWVGIDRLIRKELETVRKSRLELILS